MGSFLNFHTFCFFLIFACSLVEIYGRGFGGGRGGFGGGRGVFRGGYSSRGSSSSRSSSSSNSRGSYKPSSSGSSGSSSSGSSGSSNKINYGLSSNNYGSRSGGSYVLKSGGSYGSKISRGIGYGTMNRMYAGSSESRWNNNDQESHKSKLNDADTRKEDSTYRPPSPRHTTTRPWTTAPAKSVTRDWDEWWTESSRRVREPPHPFQREIDRINESSKRMQGASSIDLTELASGNNYRNRRNRFQKRHACEDSQCLLGERRKTEDDTSTVNTSPSLNSLRKQEVREEQPIQLIKDSQSRSKDE